MRDGDRARFLPLLLISGRNLLASSPWPLRRTNGCQQDTSTGRRPAGSVFGDAAEALQREDSNNISDPRDNLEDALAMEAKWILRMYSRFDVDGLVMSNRVSDEEKETL